MKKFIAVIPFLILAACSDNATGPCTEFCQPGRIVVRTEFLENVFAPRVVRNGVAYWAPGDSIAIRYTIENATASSVDSLFFQASTFNSIDGTERYIERIAANDRLQWVDTVSIAQFVYDSAQRLHINFHTLRTVSEIPHAREGDSIAHLLTRGFDVDVLTVPSAQVVQRAGRDPLTVATIRALTASGFLLRLRNDSDLPTLPTRLNSCWWDIDFCAEQFPPSDVIPAIQPGATYDLELPITIQHPDRIFYPWGRGLGSISICSPGRDGFECEFVPALILPNIEALCAVTTVEVGATTTVKPADCGAGNYGSAYRFAAARGERYRVETVGVANGGFITSADGVETTDLTQPGLVEVAIPKDGTYYVIIPNTGATSFRLIRL